MIDFELRGKGDVALKKTALYSWYGATLVIDCGMIIICKAGEATMSVNFKKWTLTEGSVITLFPNDMVTVDDKSDDFEVELLRYSATLLREASLQLEQAVYSLLKEDRCCSDSPVPTNIINNMFALLGVYFNQPNCRCLEQLVLYQLKAFFIGFYDYICQMPHKVKGIDDESPRTKELFNRFMMELEYNFKESRDVGYYAQRLNITPKYLNIIANRITGHTVKTLINHYVILQIKQSLRSQSKSVKEIAWEYKFSDISFFCRYFKQHTGITPLQFIKNGIAEV